MGRACGTHGREYECMRFWEENEKGRGNRDNKNEYGKILSKWITEN
jgi:hypothetical protein